MNPLDKIIHTVKAELEQTKALLHILEEEHQCLKSGKAVELPEMAGKKEHLVKELAKLEKKRRDLERAHGPIPKEITGPLLAELETSLKGIQELNKKNGYMIEVQLQHVNYTLDILSSPNQKTGGGTYDPHGRKHTRIRGRTLGQA